MDNCDFVEAVYIKPEAEQMFNLPASNIGDLFVIAKERDAFGEGQEGIMLVKTRTHGSLHEREIPLISVNSRRNKEEYQYSKDIVSFILNDSFVKGSNKTIKNNLV